MSEKLTQEEVQALLNKIREEYQKIGSVNPSVKLHQFEQRYLLHLKERGNIEKFLSEEMIFLEQLKDRLKVRRAKREAAEAPTINKIIEENESRLTKYPKIDFHLYAKNEIKYLYGAISDFAQNDLQLLYKIFKGTPEIRLFDDYIFQIERIGSPKKGILSARINDHIQVLNIANGNHVKIEQESQILLRDSCIALKNIVQTIEDCLKGNKIRLSNEIIFHEKEDAHLSTNFNGITHGTAIQKIMQTASQIIVDFRMEGLLSLKK